MNQFNIGLFRELYKKDENLAIEYLEKELTKEYLTLIDSIEMVWRFISWSSGLLSESFIERYQNNLNWYYIVQEQNLSFDFLIKHKNKVIKICLIKNEFINENIKNKFFGYLELLQ
jgi:hypothetical protein